MGGTLFKNFDLGIVSISFGGETMIMLMYVDPDLRFLRRARGLFKPRVSFYGDRGRRWEVLITRWVRIVYGHDLGAVYLCAAECLSQLVSRLGTIRQSNSLISFLTVSSIQPTEWASSALPSPSSSRTSPPPLPPPP